MIVLVGEVLIDVHCDNGCIWYQYEDSPVTFYLVPPMVEYFYQDTRELNTNHSVKVTTGDRMIERVILHVINLVGK